MKQNRFIKIIQWVALVFGVIILATSLAFVVFYTSVPTKEIQHTPDHSINSHVNQVTSVTPEATLDESTRLNQSPRDPFLAPVNVWPYLKSISNNLSDHDITYKTSDSKVYPPSKSNTLGKCITNNIHSSKQQNQKNQENTSTKVTASPTQDNQEPPDPNLPEYKERLILPDIHQGNNNSVTETQKMNYKVKPGETILEVAQKFNVSAALIFKENGLTSTNGKLAESKQLIVPVPKNRLYKIKPEDTLPKIAIRFGTTVELLRDINNYNDSTKLVSGQMVVLPIAVVNKN